MAVSDDFVGCLAYVERLVREGLSLRAVLLELVFAASRRLGDDWAADRRSFADVSVGLSTLQRVVGVVALDDQRRDSARGEDEARGLVLVATPRGEQHTLGIQVLGEILRVEGWDVLIEAELDVAGLEDLVASRPIVAVGLSVSCREHLSILGQAVDAVRRGSQGRRVGVVVGGCAAAEEIVVRCDASYCDSVTCALRTLEPYSRRRSVPPQNRGS